MPQQKIKKSPERVNSPAQKPALVLVHGFRGAPLGLFDVRDELEQLGYTDIHIPPIPPFANAPQLSSYTPAAYADYLLDYCQSLHLDHPVLIGHSMGSIIVAATLQQYPNFFSSKSALLSPISTRPILPIRLISPLSGLLPTSLIDYITTKFLSVRPTRAQFQHILDLTHQCSHDHTPTKRETMRATKFSTSYSVADFPSSAHFLFLAGETDRLISQQSTQQLAQKFSAQTIFLPDTGHIHTYERPKATAEAIHQFLQQS